MTDRVHAVEAVHAAETFRTSFGRTIRCVPGYFEAHPTATSIGYTEPPGATRLGIDGFIKDTYTYALLMDFFENLGVRTRWQRALDIGGAEGTVSRLLRGENRAEWTAALDLYDLGSLLTTRTCLEHAVRFRLACAASRWSPALRRFLLGDGVWRGKRLTPLYPNFGRIPPESSTFWNLRLRRLPRLDDYIVKDVYELHGTFDLVTSVLALPWFDAERKFRKVSELLSPGGHFVFLSDYWWFPVNSALLVGRFPYAAQRLTAEDFRRYVRQFHAADYDAWMARYNYFHLGTLHPTLDDYVRLADRFGLEMLGTQRFSPPYLSHNRAVVGPRMLNRSPETALTDVLDDIHQFRPDVGLEDLTTNYVMAAFVKRP